MLGVKPHDKAVRVVTRYSWIRCSATGKKNEDNGECPPSRGRHKRPRLGWAGQAARNAELPLQLISPLHLAIISDCEVSKRRR